MFTCRRPHLGRWTRSSGMVCVRVERQVYFARRRNSPCQSSRPWGTNQVPEKETPLHGGGGYRESPRAIHWQHRKPKGTPDVSSEDFASKELDEKTSIGFDRRWVPYYTLARIGWISNTQFAIWANTCRALHWRLKLGYAMLSCTWRAHLSFACCWATTCPTRANSARFMAELILMIWTPTLWRSSQMRTGQVTNQLVRRRNIQSYQWCSMSIASWCWHSQGFNEALPCAVVKVNIWPALVEVQKFFSLLHYGSSRSENQLEPG